jgi:hypothetical protein
MNHENYINEALEIVSAWEVPEEDFAQVVNDQARLMAGMDLELSGDPAVTSPYSPLQF